ncbi:acyl-CoA N-acyltransferase [Halenospora varia]|nr:acyl-CoA N-acyltransferase [Halenospora varia]
MANPIESTGLSESNLEKHHYGNITTLSRAQLTTTLETSYPHSIKLNIPGNEEYFLTTFEESDAEPIQEILQIDAVSDNLISAPKPYTLDDSNFWLTHQLKISSSLLPITNREERTKAFFSLTGAVPPQIPLQVIRHGEKFVGCCSLTRHEGENAADELELGYYLSPEYHGRRIMGVAAKEALKHVRDDWGIRAIYAQADGENERSQKVIAKIVEDTKVSGGKVETGSGTLKWPGEKVGGKKGERVERKSMWWRWQI